MAPTYSISSVEGIGEKFTVKLKQAGIRSVNALLEKGASRKGRKELAEKTGIDESKILEWVNRADLYRVNGIGEEYSDLLEQAGVDTVKELRNRNAENLYEALKKANTKGRAIVRQLPGLKQVSAWIEEAKKLPPMVTY